MVAIGGDALYPQASTGRLRHSRPLPPSVARGAGAKHAGSRDRPKGCAGDGVSRGASLRAAVLKPSTGRACRGSIAADDLDATDFVLQQPAADTAPIDEM